MNDVNDLNYFQQYFVHEFVEEYKIGHMSRRDMIRRVLYITGGVASTATLLASMGCQPAPAAPTAAPAAKPTVAPTTATAASPAVQPGAAASPAASPVAAASPAVSPAASPVAAASPSPVPGAHSPLSVPANDPSIDGRDITFQGNGATLIAYEARPRDATGPLPVVLVCQQNRGVDEHIRDVTRRFARAGYLASAVDLLSREGGTRAISDPARIPSLLSGQDKPPLFAGDFKAAYDYYQTQSGAVGERIGMTGYCFGGGITWLDAEQIAGLKAAVPFYGARPPLDQVPNIKAAVFGVYSSDPNDFANNGRDQLEAALQAANVTYQIKVYPDTRHAFHDDTGASYNETQALAAWTDTLAWFQKYLRA